MSESHGNDYASNPLMVNSIFSMLNKNNNKIKSGETYSLSFNITDLYGQLVKDTSKYYSNIILYLNYDQELYKDDDYFNDDDIKLTDNNCIFSNGNEFFIIPIYIYRFINLFTNLFTYFLILFLYYISFYLL